MLSSSRLVRSCTPRACSQRSVTTRAAANADEFSVVDVDAFAGRVSVVAESAVDTLQAVSGEAAAAGGAQLNDLVDRVKDISEDIYAEALASGRSLELPTLDMPEFAIYAEKASQLSTDVISQSHSLAGQLSARVSEQLETLPEVQARLSAQFGTLLGEAESALTGATDASEAFSRQVMNEVVPRMSSEVESLTQLAAEGHYADAATSPAGIAVAGIGVLLIGGIAASSRSSSPTSTSSSPPSTSSIAPASPAENQASAEAWIARWRNQERPQDTPLSLPASPPPIMSSGEENGDNGGSGSSSEDDTATSAAADASGNGVFSSNGAAPAEDPAGSTDMTFAEYVSGDASADDGAAGGWYVASDSDSEDNPYSGIYGAEKDGAGPTTSWRTAMSELAANIAARASAAGTESEGEVPSGATDTEGVAEGTASTATLAGT